MSIRPATEADAAVLRELWEELQAEVPEPAVLVQHTWEGTWPSLREEIVAGAVFVAEDEQGPVGFANAVIEDATHVRLDTIYVRPRSRRERLGHALVAAVAAHARGAGAAGLTLYVLETNTLARTFWSGLGFEPVMQVLAQPLDTLEARLAGSPDGTSHASTHVQSDDRRSVDRTLAEFVPHLGEPAVRESGEGWIRIADAVLDRDRNAQSKLAHELSERLGAVVVALAVEHGAVVRFKLYERGRMVDEYLSVPTFYGPISKGDELALEANPTLVSRLTGANRDELRHTTRTAANPTDLPPADELYEQIARVMRLEP